MVADDPGQLRPLFFAGVASKISHGKAGEAADGGVSGVWSIGVGAKSSPQLLGEVWIGLL